MQGGYYLIKKAEGKHYYESLTSSELLESIIEN